MWIWINSDKKNYMVTELARGSRAFVSQVHILPAPLQAEGSLRYLQSSITGCCASECSFASERLKWIPCPRLGRELRRRRHPL